jgi:hypothetical protein
MGGKLRKSQANLALLTEDSPAAARAGYQADKT